MRNAFVVLVSLCIGLVSGFVVPSSVPEYTTRNSITDTTTKTAEIKSITLFPKHPILPKIRNDIDEKELYEHATERQNNQSERAFIYINQKFRKPARNKIIMKHEKPDKEHKTPPTPVAVAQTPCPSAFDSGHSANAMQSYNLDFSGDSIQSINPDLSGVSIQSANPALSEISMQSVNPALSRTSVQSVNPVISRMSMQSQNPVISKFSVNSANSVNSAMSSTSVNSALPANSPKTYFQGYDSPDKPNEMASYFVAPNIFRCNFYDKTKVKDAVQTQMKPKNKADERRDYFELLKPPILRPITRVNNKANYKGNRPVKISSLSSLNKSQKDGFLKNFNVKSQYSNNAFTADERHDEIRSKYGYDRPSNPHSLVRNKEILHKSDDGNFGNEFTVDDDTKRIFEANQDEDKLLNKYLKDTLEEQAASNDKGATNDCSYSDCILQTSKKYMKNGFRVKPDCKCGRRLNIKYGDPFLAKDRSLRQEVKPKETATKSAEVNYEDLLTDDSSTMIQLDDDVIGPPNKTMAF